MNSAEDFSDARRTKVPVVSVIMPVRNEGGFLGRAIDSIIRSGAGVPSYEIIVVDGMSDDDTREVVSRAQARHDNVTLLDNPARTVPLALNIGVRAAAADVVVRVDGHAEVDAAFLAASLMELDAHPECACVGGPIESVDLDPESASISLAMSSRFGVGNARFRTGGAEGYVDTLAFGAYRKADLLAVGLFDEELARNQDDELNYRIVSSGRKIWFSHAIKSRYYVRSSLRNLFRQYFQYGYWKMYVNRKHGTITSLRQLAPPLFVTLLACLLVASPFLADARTSLVAVLATYLLAAGYFAFDLTKDLGKAVGVIKAFSTLHVGYGLGYLAGVRDFLILRRRPATSSAELSR